MMQGQLPRDIGWSGLQKNLQKGKTSNAKDIYNSIRFSQCICHWRNPENAVVAATKGILSFMNDNEIEAVMAHELGHVKIETH